MNLFRIILWSALLLFLTIFTAQNLSESFPIYFLFFKINIPSVVAIFFFMFLGSIFILPFAFKKKKKIDKKEAKKEEKQNKKEKNI